MSGWAADRFSLWAEVEVAPGDVREFDVAQASARFPLNDVPKASLTVALGRRVDTNRAAEIHRVLNRLRVKRRVRVYCRAETIGVFGALGVSLWPRGRFLVFDGYTTGAGYQRAADSAGYTLECEHWLADLGYASAVSAASSPANPADMTFNALTAGAAETAGGPARTGGYTGLTKAEEFVSAGTVASDLWGDALRPFFAALAAEETLAGTAAAAAIGLDLGPVPPGNAAALAALDRFEPKAPRRFGVPLRFDPAAYGGDLAVVAAQIANALGAETLEALSGTTVWDKLVQYAGAFLFAVVPLVDRCLVVPFMPGLRQPYKTVTAAEYGFVRLAGDMPRVLRGVGIYGGKGFEGGGELAGDDAVDYDRYSVGGYFQGASTGQVLFKQAPMWMALPDLSAEVDRAAGGDGLPRGDALNPGAGRPPVGPRPKDKAEANARLMNKYAEALYVYEVLKLRAGDLSGRLRFDIAPGSVLRIEGCGEKFLGVDDQFGEPLYATVLQTDFFLDAESQKAGTSFHLAHYRNELENTTPGFSAARHPLWAEPWAGAPLVAFD